VADLSRKINLSCAYLGRWFIMLSSFSGKSGCGLFFSTRCRYPRI